MTKDAKEPILTAIFVDYDNIYLSLKKRSEEAAKRFAKDAVSWIKEIENGRLITPSNSPTLGRPRRIVVNRCYGNPVPRRNAHDNSTDMTSFPFVRHHFLRAGFEVVDCPPLTAQLKNSSDIKMVMDATDHLDHATRFDEFIILSGDADFTPLLHRLRAYDRRTAIFANDFTAAAYMALCDGEVREATLMSVLLEGKLGVSPTSLTATAPAASTVATAHVTAPASVQIPVAPMAAAPVRAQVAAPAAPDANALERMRAEIVAAVTVAVKAAVSPVPLEALAERTTRALGHDRTVGTNWAGSSSFLELLRRHLPAEIRLTEQPPYLAYEAARAIAAPAERPMPILEPRAPFERQLEPARQQAPHAPLAQAPVAQAPVPQAPVARAPIAATPVPPAPTPRLPQQPVQQQPQFAQHPEPAPLPLAPQPVAQPVAQQQPHPQAAPRQADMAAMIQASISRIHDACQAPLLSPPDYRALFDAIAAEIGEYGMQGTQTLVSIHTRAQQIGLNVSRDDNRFVMEVISEADPWFEQGASANLFAGRFRNFVVARCRSQGLNLSSDELDLIEAWFAGGTQQIAPQSIRVQAPSAEIGAPPAPRQLAQAPQSGSDQNGGDLDQFPKILRTRLRG